MSKITIYTDGSASPNPGKGGLGIILISGKHRKEISCGYKLTTNNRMELMSVVMALESLKTFNNDITIYSDSQYVVNSINKKWINKWITKDWKDVKNIDLWKRYLESSKNQNISFSWIKGHSDNIENNNCDLLAVAAGKSPDLLEDVEYLKNKK